MISFLHLSLKMTIDQNNMLLELEIKKRIDYFFDIINHPIVQNYFISDNKNWDALCASLHIIHDLQRAKEEYQSLSSINYLESIGIFQTIYIEQDSVKTLMFAIKEQEGRFNLEDYEEIRNIRNEIFGHPSDKGWNVKTRHFFDIIDKNKQKIKHIFWSEDNSIKSGCYVISDLIEENSRITLGYLQKIEIELKQKLDKIMESYTIDFKELFNGYSYTMGKILTKENDELAISLFDSIIEDISKVKVGLIERKIYEEFKVDYEIIEFFSTKLKMLFGEQNCNDIEFYAYASTLRHNIDVFKIELDKIDSVF